ncbi:TetR family transcriptional regulator [Nocardiopsis sp. Huas11]|uniref:TetR/AcrR family transcriptional regulator n=1 Tax=Nocardiopsis sp. Huas11 TaxID=2183912 RepID=UPI000EAC3674|nr:TetR/AcrR family transcriptional regulator [Nocardiopsis sp. Huas11]RKS07815.1 TetR family transcriptional regulator [Nocardiopsis sp. Huas11]
MVRLNRVEQRARNRARVLAAAGEEFAERGFRDAKVDRIAARADLTRGAVYSNFPGKRALYFAVLAEAAERADREARTEGLTEADAVRTVADALGALARAWTERFPLTDFGGPPGLGSVLTPEVLADEPTRRSYTQLNRLGAVLLGLALEALEEPGEPGRRRVRLAETVLTTLVGAAQTAVVAPGLVDPFNVIRACEGLAGLDLADSWPLPHLDHAVAAVPADEPWSPPAALDVLRGSAARLGEDGVVLALGLSRLESVEDALRSAPAHAGVAAVVVTDDPAERMPLARLCAADLGSSLRRAFPGYARPRLRLVLDETGEIAAAVGAREPGDTAEAAVRVCSGRVVARARGRGAGHAAAISGARQGVRS